MKKILAFLCFGALACFAKPVVSVSILPQEFFVKQIAGDTVEVNTMVSLGTDPHTYEPKPKQMKSLENSKLYFAIGIEFEEVWLPKFQQSFPKLKFIFTQKGIERVAMQEHEHEGHAHDKKEHCHEHNGKVHCHSHDGLDPHIWLDPVLVKTQAKNILNGLVRVFPEHKELYNANYEKFLVKLDELDKFIKDKLANLKNREFIVYHPSWGYFAKRYDLEQISIEVEGKEPKPAELANLIKEAKEHGVKVIFVAPQFSKKSANLIAKETGAKVVEIDQLPLDWEAELKKTAEIFAKSL
ncbi:zinc ABC transporter substrate-binding protein [Campylobacter sp. RM15925]|uniref:metal ABC transporter solute-binding protein, Zn/Mn family n=1 Tax=Campylobacter sp. RM15925 TaxID=1705724 RepID=UPI001474E1C7|nr:zinc ABC transporter substrate-binding protein [Campylobacter sp. RM15925]